MAKEKSNLLSYHVTDRKLREAARRVIAEDDEITVKRVAEVAGVSLSTAYAHDTLEMLKKELEKDEE